MIKDFNYYDFDIVEFSRNMEDGDIWGLNYIEETIINNLKKQKNEKYTYNDYILNLFSSVIYLNECNYMFECTDVKTDFNCDLYFTARDMLLDALGIDYNFDYHIYQFKKEEEGVL